MNQHLHSQCKHGMRQWLMAAFLIIGMFVTTVAWGPQARAQAGSTVSGVVLDEEGEPMIGASVVPEGQKTGVVTNIDGEFFLKISEPCNLVVSYVGYDPMTVKAAPGDELRIELKNNSNVLDEVVVVGFGTQKKINLTGSVGVASSKDLEGRPVQSAAAALQGVIPGLNISNSTSGGELNASKQVNVRGMTTIGDGSSGEPLILIDGMEGDISTINPNDIESISVLKDAAASSIYGSRAPFGVIMITTKSGTAGKSHVRYDNSFRFNKPLTTLKMMDSWQYINYLNDVSANTSPGSTCFPEDFVEQAYAYYTGQSDNYIYENKWDGTHYRWGTGECAGTFANVDWIDELYKDTAFSQEHNVTLTGGSDKTTYYISGNYLEQGGFMKYGNDNYQRYSVMGKINTQMFPWLNVQYTGRWIRTDYQRPTIMTGGFYEKVLRRLVPTNPKYDPNGYIAADYNYIEHLENGGKHNEQNDVFTNQLKFVITPVKNWNIIAELNARVNSDWTHEATNIVYAHDCDALEGLSSETMHIAFDSSSHDSVYEYSYRSTFLNYNFYTEYMANFAEKNNVKLMVGSQFEDFKYRNLNASREDMLTEDLPVLNLTTSSDSYSLGGQYQKWRTAGFFGRINYDYDSKYLIEVNLRYDGSSRFRSNRRWVWSPSASLGWNIARESFWEGLQKYIPSFKFRASYGQLANQNTTNWYPTYRIMSVTNQGSSWLVDGLKQNTASFPALITQSLTWEKIRTTNLGLDWAAFNYRFLGSFDYFWRKNFDMVGAGVEYPKILGCDVPKENLLAMRTYGWELQLTWQDRIGDFNYQARLNLSDDQTRILEYPNAEQYLSKYIAGELVGNIYGLTTVGIAQTQAEMDAHLATVDQSYLDSGVWMAGDMMYADINGDGKITKGTTLNDLGDLKLLGNTSPRYRFGLNLFAEWKGIDFNIFFQGVLKRDYYFDPNGGQGSWGKSAVFWGATSGGRYESLFLQEHLDYWRDDSSLLGANYDAYYARPLYYTNKNREIQTKYMQDASYVRLKNLQVGYTFPQKWMEKLSITKLRVYFAAENLHTWTNLSKVIDPESLETSALKSGSSYPLSKTISFGLSVDF
ncbi:MAG: TonB-dependent receptor [Bacteroidales bacterium]|nr:TonB-dependent receptor [Bacteroidales bacterium]